jgi:hypothetical protein
MSIQDKIQEIHYKYGFSEKGNYEIQLFVEDLIKKDRAEQLNLSGVGSNLGISKETELTPLIVTENGNKEICKVSHEYFKLDDKKKKDFLDTLANWVHSEMN